MSKKNKKKINKGFEMFFGGEPFPEDQPKEGDLRFFQTKVLQEKERWWGWDCKTLKESPRILQRFDGKDWKDIPSDVEYIYV